MIQLAEKIKHLNKSVSKEYAGTKKYWMRSPSNILLEKTAHESLQQYGYGKKVLDAGAGKLAYKGILTTYFSEYTSSDFMQTHPDLDVVSDIEDLSFKSETFDTVFCSQVLEHVPHPWKALSELCRVLKKHGVLIVTVPMLGYIHNAPYDFYRYTEYGLQILAEEAGFSVEKIVPIGGFFSFLGYVRSTLLMPLYALPVVGKVILYTNYAFSHVDIFLDSVTKNARIFPLNYLLVAKKK